MKTTTVPAQVTTVEDKIAGNLTLSQILLFITPLFVGTAIYLVFPPVLHLTILKFVISFLILLISVVMAIRIKGKILLLWTIVIARYVSRPRYYVFNKNDSYSRDKFPVKQSDPLETKKDTKTTELKFDPSINITPLQRLQLETVLADPRANIHFRTNRKGALSVHVTEVK